MRERADSYPVRLLGAPRPTRQGLEHGAEGRREQLAWREVQGAFAAEIGEPEGVRTIVFDLIVSLPGGGWQALRSDAEPGEEAMRFARAIEAGIGPATPSCSIKSLATDAVPARWYPDLGAFEEDVAAWVQALALGTGRRSGVR